MSKLLDSSASAFKKSHIRRIRPMRKPAGAEGKDLAAPAPDVYDQLNVGSLMSGDCP